MTSLRQNPHQNSTIPVISTTFQKSCAHRLILDVSVMSYIANISGKIICKQKNYEVSKVVIQVGKMVNLGSLQKNVMVWMEILKFRVIF